MNKFSLKEIAARIGGELVGNGDIVISGAAEIDKAQPGQISFLANPRYRKYLDSTRASAVIIDGKTELRPSIPHIRVADAYYGFLQTFVMFHPPQHMLSPGVHPSAVIDPSCKLGQNVAIGAHVFLGPRVQVGDNTRIFPNSVILNDSRVGKNCCIYPLVSIRENCVIGDRVIIHNGAVIGSDGFGFVPHEGVYEKIPQVGKVVIEDDVEIGANATIDRATMGATIVRKGTKLDNLVHLAHNVEVGEHTVMAAQTGISGSTRIGKRVMIGGQVGTVGHITIGDGAQIGAQSGVSKSIPPGEVFFGYPARPIMKAKRIEAALSQLPDLLKRVRELERQLKEIQNK